AGASFIFEKVYDVTKLQPVIAKPHSPDNRAFVADIKGTKLDRAYIGSCTGGKMTDFRAAASVLTGKTVRIDTFVVPATSEIAQGLKTETLNGQTLEEVFLSAGAKIGEPSCAASHGRAGGPAAASGKTPTTRRRASSRAQARSVMASASARPTCFSESERDRSWFATSAHTSTRVFDALTARTRRE